MRHRQIDFDSVPFKPNANKYRYLLQNEYPDISSLGAKSSTVVVDEPGSASSPGKKLLGDFTLYKVNKEFENF